MFSTKKQFFPLVLDLCIGDGSKLALDGLGIGSGVVVQCGHAITEKAPIYERYVIPNGVCKVDFAGDDLTRFLTNILHQHGYSLNDHHQAQLFKEQFCKINFASMSAGADSSHTTTA